MNPYGMPNPYVYEMAFQWAIGFMLFIILSGAILVWNWRRKGPAKNHMAYAGTALALLGLTPVEQLIGSGLSAEAAYTLSRIAHYARYGTSAAAMFLTAAGLIRMYVVARRRPIGGQLAGLIGLVLGGLTGLFNHTQQLWKVEGRPELKDQPRIPALRGGFVVTQPRYNFGFVVPSRDWAQERELVRAQDVIVELTQRTQRGRSRVFVEPGVPSVMALRDRCVASMKARHPNLIIEKEQKKTIHQFEALRILARGTGDLGEQKFLCTVYAGAETGYRMESWSAARNYAQLEPDFETMHDTFQELQRKPGK